MTTSIASLNLIHPTYIVLPLPPSIGTRIKALRERYDPHLATYPSEMTVAGSSGLGTLAAGQDPTAVIETLGRLSAAHLPFESRFVAIRQFETGPVIWLQPEDPEPFISLHNAIAASGLSFLPHRFPYTPHCSLATTALSAAESQALRDEDFPHEIFDINQMSLYAVVEGTPRLVTHIQPIRVR